MNRHVINISAVFLKDLRQLWPLAALAAAAVLAHTLGVPVLTNGLHNAALLISGIFIIALIQQDSPASLRHEWLTRPVGSLDVLLAKILLAAAAILLPAIIGPIISAARHGTAVPDAFLLAVAGMKFNIIGAFVLLLVAAVTSTLIQAAGVLAGLVLFQTVAQLVPGQRVWGMIVLVTLVGGLVVLWLQYAQRRTIAARGALGATIGILTIAMGLLVGTAGHAHSQTKPSPAASPAIDGIMAAFRNHPLVGLGDAHGMAQEQDFYAALVRDPRFAREVGNLVLEIGNATDQDIIDRYVDGQNVPYTELRKVWTDAVGWAPPPFDLGYVNLLAQVRVTNLSLPAGRRIHVWLGDPPLDWSKVKKREDVGFFPYSRRDSYPAELIEREILNRGRKALVIYGWFHFNTDKVLQAWLGPEPSLVALVEQRHPGAFFLVTPYTGYKDKDCAAEFEANKKDWLAPSFLAPVRGTALDDPAFRLRCPLGTLRPPGKLQNAPDLIARMQGLLAGMGGDALLYLGPSASLTESPVLPDAYLDEDYRKEILRHWGIFGMSAEASDMTFDKNPASPRPFGY